MTVNFENVMEKPSNLIWWFRNFQPVKKCSCILLKYYWWSKTMFPLIIKFINQGTYWRISPGSPILDEYIFSFIYSEYSSANWWIWAFCLVFSFGARMFTKGMRRCSNAVGDPVFILWFMAQLIKLIISENHT